MIMNEMKIKRNEMKKREKVKRIMMLIINRKSCMKKKNIEK